MTRKIFIFGFAAGIVGLALACSSESSSSGGNGNGTSSGTSGSEGSSGTSGSNGGNGSGFKNCGVTSGTSCTEAEMKPYSDCLTDKCDTGYKKCYGDGYKSGTFSGPCGTWMACVQKCDCNDTSCILACKPDEACQACSTEISTCGDSCTEPECSKQGVPDGGNNANATCADLQACCDSMAAGEQKDGCQSALDDANDDDTKCAPYYNAFKTAGFCN